MLPAERVLAAAAAAATAAEPLAQPRAKGQLDSLALLIDGVAAGGGPRAGGRRRGSGARRIRPIGNLIQYKRERELRRRVAVRSISGSASASN